MKIELKTTPEVAYAMLNTFVRSIEEIREEVARNEANNRRILDSLNRGLNISSVGRGADLQQLAQSINDQARTLKMIGFDDLILIQAERDGVDAFQLMREAGVL